MVRATLLPDCVTEGCEFYYDSRLTCKLASSWPSQCRARPSHACGTQKWRDSQRPPRHLRYVDEFDFEGGCPDQPGTAHFPSSTRVSKPFLRLCHDRQTQQDSSDRKLTLPYRRVTSFGDYQRSTLRAITWVFSTLVMACVCSDSSTRSNTYECRTRSSTWLRINNKVSRVTTEAEADKEVTMVGEGTEVEEVEEVEGPVVEEEDHDTGRDKRTPSRR